jgi:hypothetical protein
MTDSERIIDLQKKLTAIQVFQAIVMTVTVLGFLGIITIYDLKKGK